MDRLPRRGAPRNDVRGRFSLIPSLRRRETDQLLQLYIPPAVSSFPFRKGRQERDLTSNAFPSSLLFCYHLVVMETPDQQEMFDYYNERAPEYEEFYHGQSIPRLHTPEIYQKNTATIYKLVKDYVKGKCLDIACGTGFWLPAYQENCPEITLIDQSESVLDECRKKIDGLGIHDKTEIIQGEIFTHPYKYHNYDSILLGFLISHLTDADLDNLAGIARKALAPGGRVVIIDSLWSDVLLRGGREKEGMLKRKLKDGREFEIYKRFYEPADLESFAERNNMDLEIPYWGEVFFLASLVLKKG